MILEYATKNYINKLMDKSDYKMNMLDSLFITTDMKQVAISLVSML